MFVAVVSIILVSILANVFLERQFRCYVINVHQRKSADAVKAISEQYISTNNWNKNVIEQIGISGLENGLIISVVDTAGQKIWDAREHNNGMCEAMISHFSKNMISHYSNWNGGYVNNNFQVVNSGKVVGIVSIGYYGPYYFSDNDLAFLNTLNKLFISVGIISLILALVISLLMSEALTRPILKTIKAAKAIAKGNFKDRIKEESSINEVNELIVTINNLAQSLEVQERLRKRLTGDVSHELRTPLATLQSHMEAILDGIWEPTIERIRSCHEETIRINRLVGDMEKLAQYESENLQLIKTEFNFGEVLANIIMNFEREYLNKGIELNYSREDLYVKADKDKMSQVVINIISNALKYTPSGGNVDISIKKSDDKVLLKVSDTGVGISKEDLPFIFERFYRADKSRNRMTGGAGIGLTITKAIVEAHKGSISLVSELNKGTEFIVIIPVNT